MSVRALARTIEPHHPERARRNLVRWIGGYNEPSRFHRVEVAEALGMAPDAFLDDDEEDDLVVDLVRIVRKVVREELARLEADA